MAGELLAFIEVRLFVLMVIAAPLLAQSFEVASVKRSNPESGSGARSTGAVPRQQETGRINYPNVKLKGVIALAYGVGQDQIEGPEWLDDERYDIVATLPDNAPEEQVPVMIQHLLAERFGMTVHEETKQRSGFALTTGKGALQLKTVEENAPAGFSSKKDRVEVMNVTMNQFAKFLSLTVGRPFVDETGIQGHFNLTLNASMADIKSGSVSGVIEDLGLKLVSRPAPAKFVIIDKGNKIPTEN